MVCVLYHPEGSVPVSEMNDGDVGVIEEWTGSSQHIGKVVQRYRDAIVVLGESYKKAFDAVLRNPAHALTDCRVRILQEGETIRIGPKLGSGD